MRASRHLGRNCDGVDFLNVIYNRQIMVKMRNRFPIFLFSIHIEIGVGQIWNVSLNVTPLRMSLQI